MSQLLISRIESYIRRLDEYCSVCGNILSHIKEPLSSFPFVEIIEDKFNSGDLYESICFYCEKGKRVPFVWIGDLPGYVVSENGSLWSLRQKKYMKPKVHYRDNHLYFNLYVTNKKRTALNLHKLVLLKFKFDDKSDPLEVGRHYDDDKKNNRVDNLLWGTSKDNARDRIRNRKK